MTKIILIAALFLTAVACRAQTVTCELSWTLSTTLSASNVIYLARSPTSATNVAGGAYRFDVGTNRLIRATLSPGVWNVAVRAAVFPLESAPTFLVVTVPAAVTELSATFPELP